MIAEETRQNQESPPLIHIVPPTLSKQLANATRIVGEGGGVIDVSRQGDFTVALVDVVELGADAGSQVVVEAIKQTFDAEGQVGPYEQWKGNERATLIWKSALGEDGEPLSTAHIRVGRTGTQEAAVHGNIEVRGQGGVLRRGGKADMRRTFRTSKKMRMRGGPETMVGQNVGTTRFIGIFDNSRPAEYHGKTVAEMFAIHEFGTPDGHIPPRPLLSRAADVASQASLEVASETIRRAAGAISYELGLEVQAELQEKLLALKTFRMRAKGTAKSKGFIDPALEREVLGHVPGSRQAWAEEMRRQSGFEGSQWRDIGRGTLPIKRQVLDVRGAASKGRLDQLMRESIAKDPTLTGGRRQELYKSYQSMLGDAFRRTRAVSPSKTGFRSR